MDNVFNLDPTDPLQMDLFPQAMADVHVDCILNSNTIATFLPPLNRQEIIDYYTTKATDISTGKYSIITEWHPINNSNPSPSHTVIWNDRELAGFVMLHRHPTETGPFRADVEKLLVSSRYRKRGVARHVMARLEDEARRTDSWLLLLDTEIGSGAELVYPKLGYISYGVIPNYGISPKDNRSLCDEMFFYKDLRQPPGAKSL